MSVLKLFLLLSVLLGGSATLALAQTAPSSARPGSHAGQTVQKSGQQGQSQPVCDVKKEERALRDRIFEMNGRTRNHPAHKKWQKMVLALLAKRKLEGEAQKKYLLELRQRIGVAAVKAAGKEATKKLGDQIFNLVFSISDIAKQPPEKACAGFKDVEQKMKGVIDRVAQQIEKDWGVAKKILEAEMAQTP